MVTQKMSVKWLSNAGWSVLVKTIIGLRKNRHVDIALERTDFHDKMFKSSIDDSEVKVIKHCQQKNFLPL